MPRPKIRRRLVAGCLLLWATGLVARAHAQTRTAERAPDLPAVDFVALGADGRAAPDITAADGGAPGMPLFSALEVARTLDGPALANLRLALERAAEGRYVATGAIPLGALPPGDFVVRATVGIEGQPAVQIVRTLRKAPR